MFGFLKKVFNVIKNGYYNFLTSANNNRVVRNAVRRLESGVNNPNKKDYYIGEYNPNYAKLRKQKGLDIEKFHLIYKGDFKSGLFVEQEGDKVFMKAKDKPFLLEKYKSIFDDI